MEKLLIRLGLPSKEEWPEIYLSPRPEQALNNELVRIKQNGYDILDDQHGITGFAAPLFKNGHVIGSVGIYLPNDRLTDKGKVLDALLLCSKAINRKLSLSGASGG